MKKIMVILCLAVCLLTAAAAGAEGASDSAPAWTQNLVDAITAGNSAVNNIVWGIPMLVLLIGTGIYFSIRTHFFQVIYAKFVTNMTFLGILKNKKVKGITDKKAISQFQALSTALAATIGVGNIAGVATAITIGGPGAVFWMWVSAFFGMMTNYSENVLGIYFRRKNAQGEWSGGAMHYIENGFQDKKFFRHIGKPLAVLFSVFCVLASFGIGNMSQVNTIATSMNGAFGIPPLAIGIALAILAGLVIIGGVKRIAKVAESIVPFMAIAYILATLVILIMHIQQVPAVFAQIFQGAFGVQAGIGGVSGVLMKEAVTMGFKRGVFSNEAGLGSSVMVHSSTDVKEPVVQGIWGIFEVFFDTIIVCTLTAFTVLSSVNLGTTSAEGVNLVTEAFATSFHSAAGGMLAIAVTLFAFTTVLGWSFYGTKAMEYLFGMKSTIYYKIVFIVFIVVGAVMKLSLAWDISDTFNGLMAIPNLIGILVLSGLVIKITRNYVGRKIKKNAPDVKPMLSHFEEIQVWQEEEMRKEDEAVKEETAVQA
ncbi:MAG: sodium:alanine symporter family protein [Eubacteriales bacterium]|nr:sodium:alanine symporter family protein [Eubacteriales bacterium]